MVIVYVATISLNSAACQSIKQITMDVTIPVNVLD